MLIDSSDWASIVDFAKEPSGLTEIPLVVPNTTWKTHFGNGRELLLATGIALVTFQALQIAQHW
jgi:hypothetical protein